MKKIIFLFMSLVLVVAFQNCDSKGGTNYAPTSAYSSQQSADSANQSNEDFVLSKYREILDRTDAEMAQDQAGLNYWVDLLNSESITRGEMEQSFRDSNEYFMRDLYKSILKRRADWAGLGFWVNALEANSTNRSAVIAEFQRVCANKINGECNF